MTFSRTKPAAHCVGRLSLTVTGFLVVCVLCVWNVGSSLKNLFIILLKKTVEERTGPCFRLRLSGIWTPTLKAKHLLLRERLNHSDRD